MTQEIALVLSDVIMPQMGGIALFQALKEIDPGVRMILMTGHVFEEQLDVELADLKAQGLRGWLHKPPNLEVIAQAVNEGLRA